MKHTYIILLLSILAAGAVSCNKTETDAELGNEISFDVFNSTKSVQVRGQRFNDASGDFTDETFGLYAWNENETLVYDNESVSYTDDKWKPATAKKWKKNAAYTFEAVYPQPEATLGTTGLTSLTTDPDPANLEFSYKVPTATEDDADKDFMLAYYSGTGSDGKAELTFTHPLTCVNFIAGTVTGVVMINSITLTGVYESGTCTVRTTTDASDRQCYSYEVSDSDDSSLWTPAGSTAVTGTWGIAPSELNATYWGYNFLLIPQKTATQKVKISINITDEDNYSYNIAKVIDEDYWRAGFTNTYKISVSATHDLVLESVGVTPWDETAEFEPELFPPGIFSVSHTKKVRFSPGNLQATYHASTSSYTWGFAEHQYDIIGNAAGNTTIDNQIDGAVVDLFGWVGESSTVTGDDKKYGINTETHYSDYGAYLGETLKNDWGTAIDNSGTWFTLSAEEWVFLLNEREQVNHWGNYRKCDDITIEGEKYSGVFLYPDDYRHYDKNIVDYTSWAEIEADGIVFMPNNYWRIGSEVSDKEGEEDIGCRYWTASSIRYRSVKGIISNYIKLPDGPDDESRAVGYPVRLVRK